MIHRFLEALLYFLSGFVPRNRNKVLFGAWEGKRIADNPRYLALYLADCKPSMELVWIGDESCRSFIPKNLSVRFVQRGSLRSWLEMLTAGTCFVSHGMPDISAFNLMRGATRVYLGHGLAIKHMGSKGKQLHSRILSAGRHLLHHSYSFQLYAASSREHSRKLLDEQVTCNIDPRQIVNSGQPRVDSVLAQPDETSVGNIDCKPFLQRKMRYFLRKIMLRILNAGQVSNKSSRSAFFLSAFLRMSTPRNCCSYRAIA